MKNNKKYEAVIIATNKRLIGKMNKKVRDAKKKKTNKGKAVQTKTLKSAKGQIRVLMREVNRLNKMLVKMAKHCA